jgi:hypothetical protein
MGAKGRYRVVGVMPPLVWDVKPWGLSGEGAGDREPERLVRSRPGPGP